MLFLKILTKLSLYHILSILLLTINLNESELQPSRAHFHEQHGNGHSVHQIVDMRNLGLLA
jgi:hypothetical protein